MSQSKNLKEFKSSIQSKEKKDQSKELKKFKQVNKLKKRKKLDEYNDKLIKLNNTINDTNYYNDTKRLLKDPNTIARDITKCYTSIMYKPVEDWIKLDFNDTFEIIEKSEYVKIQLN